MKLKLYFAASLMFAATAQISAQGFTKGNLAVFVAASNSSNNTTGSIVELDTINAGQTAINTYSIDPNFLRFSGSATSTGYMSLSNDSSLLCFVGVDTTITSINTNSVITRGAGTFNSAGTFSVAAFYMGSRGNQPRCATSIDDNTWFIADQGGIYTNGASAADPTGNFRGIKAFNDTVYVATNSSSSSNIQVNMVSAASGGTITGLPGLTNNSKLQDFYLISSGTNGNLFDILYVLSESSSSVGMIDKYSFVGNTWTSNGTYTTNIGGFGLAAQADPVSGGACLYVSSGTGSTSGNSLVKLTDIAGYNSPISITTASNIVLYTTASGTTIKGVAFAPKCKAPSLSGITNSPACAGMPLGLMASTLSGTTPFTYNWSGTGSFDDNTIQNPIVTGAASSIYSVTASNSCGTTSATVNITVNPTPTITANTTNSVICAGNMVTLTGSGASTYTWSNGVSDGVAFTPSATVVYTVTGTDANNCSNWDSVRVTINDTPMVSITAKLMSVCLGMTDTLIANTTGGMAPYMYTWTPVGTPTMTGDTTVMMPLTAGNKNWKVMVTDANNCSTKDSIMVMVNDTPTVSINAKLMTMCLGMKDTLIANASGGMAPYMYTWNPVGVPTVTGDTTVLMPGTAGSKTWKVMVTDANNCSSKDSVMVTVNPSPYITSQWGNAHICGDTSASFVVHSPGNNTYQWYYIYVPSPGTPYMIDGSSTEINYTTDSMTIQHAITGDYNNYAVYCVITNTDNCSIQSAPDTIWANALPAVVASVTSPTLCAGSTDTLIASGATIYMWSSNAGSSANDSVFVMPSSTDTYTVTGTDINGCMNMDTVSITVSNCGIGIKQVAGSHFEVYPNPANNQFNVTGLNEGAVLKLYNETGILVAESKEVNGNIIMNISSYSNGFYFIRVFDKDGSFTGQQKLVKQ